MIWRVDWSVCTNVLHHQVWNKTAAPLMYFCDLAIHCVCDKTGAALSFIRSLVRQEVSQGALLPTQNEKRRNELGKSHN
jgi:hypothetical protein